MSGVTARSSAAPAGSALAAWQARVRANRAAAGTADVASEARLVASYDRMHDTEAAARTCSWCLAQLDRPGRVLEIGPGTGAVTLALAGVAERVLAVEPSAAMRDAVRAKLSAAGVGNVTLLPRRVEDALDELGGPFDAAVAVSALYDVLPVDAVLRALHERARVTLVAMGAGRSRPWVDELRGLLALATAAGPPHWGDFEGVLAELGIAASVEFLDVPVRDEYPDERALVAGWQERLRLPDTRRDELRDVLRGMTERRDGAIGFLGRSRVALVRIEGRGGAVPSGCEGPVGREHPDPRAAATNRGPR